MTAKDQLPEVGDVLDDGSVVVGSNAVMFRGIVFVSKTMARKAERMGWQRDGECDGLVRIKKGH